MTLFQAAVSSVDSALRARQIGTPVSARIVAHRSPDHGHQQQLLGEAMAAASRWLDGRPLRVTALGRLETGQTSVLVGFEQGRTALVSVGSCGLGEPLVEIVVTGNRGILSWQPDRPGAILSLSSEQPAAEPAGALLRAVEASLESEATVALAGTQWQAAPTGQLAKMAWPAGESDLRIAKPRDPYGVLLVAGSHTHQEGYAADFAADRRCRLIAVTDEIDISDRRKRLNRRLADALQIPYLADLDEALARDDVHVVSVCVEPERRAKVLLRCAAAGKHLYIDKPMAATSSEAAEVVEAVRKAGVVTQMFSNVRWPVLAEVKETLAAGSVGDLRAIHCDLTFAKGRAGSADLASPRREAAQPEHFEAIDSKREWFNIGVYPLTLLHWLGHRVRRIAAETGNYFFTEHQKNDMEDHAVALLELEGGAIATLSVGRTGWQSHPAGGLNRTTLVGSRSAVTIDGGRPRIEVWSDQPAWEPPQRHPADPMGFWASTVAESGMRPKQSWVIPPATRTSDASHFLDCLEDGRESDVSADLAAEVVQILMAGYASAAKGTLINVVS